MSNTLGEKIRRLRKQKGYTLEKLGELTEFEQKLHLGNREQKSAAAISREDRQDSISSWGDVGLFSRYTRNQRLMPDVVDQAFFRKYRKLDPNTKAENSPDGRGLGKR